MNVSFHIIVIFWVSNDLYFGFLGFISRSHYTLNAFHQSQTVVETVKPKASVTTLLEGLTDR